VVGAGSGWAKGLVWWGRRPRGPGVLKGSVARGGAPRVRPVSQVPADTKLQGSIRALVREGLGLGRALVLGCSARSQGFRWRWSGTDGNPARS